MFSFNILVKSFKIEIEHFDVTFEFNIYSVLIQMYISLELYKLATLEVL